MNQPELAMSKLSAFFKQFTYTQLRQDVRDIAQAYSPIQIKADALTRTWLFKVVVSWCLMFGTLCLLLALAVSMKSAFMHGVSARPVVALISVALVILVTTAMMWKFSVWGRNIAVVTVACMGWVVGNSIALRTGGNLIPQVMTIVFVAMSLACFTSPAGIAMFKRQYADPSDMDDAK
jgi:Na+/melibiose symporter-like transporter